MHRFVIPARLFDEMNLLHPLEVLVVLAGSPVATPLEAGGGEEAETEVIVVYLVGEVPIAVTVRLGGGRLDEERAVCPVAVITPIFRFRAMTRASSSLNRKGASPEVRLTITLSSMAMPLFFCPILQSAAPTSASLRRASVSAPCRRHTSTNCCDRWSHVKVSSFSRAA